MCSRPAPRSISPGSDRTRQSWMRRSANPIAMPPLSRGRFTIYAGGGFGAYLFRETSDFADASDNVKEHSTAYRALAGVQWPLGRSYGAGLDVQYTTAPHGLSSGAAAAFNESNAGSVQVRARILFGR